MQENISGCFFSEHSVDCAAILDTIYYVLVENLSTFSQIS